jgi:hypothetical protein
LSRELERRKKMEEGWAEIQEGEFVDLAAAATPPGTTTWTRLGLAKINFNQGRTGENG